MLEESVRGDGRYLSVYVRSYLRRTQQNKNFVAFAVQIYWDIDRKPFKYSKTMEKSFKSTESIFSHIIHQFRGSVKFFVLYKKTPGLLVRCSRLRLLSTGCVAYSFPLQFVLQDNQFAVDKLLSVALLIPPQTSVQRNLRTQINI